MTTEPLQRLSDRELLEVAVRAAAHERHSAVALVELLAEIDARRLYLAQGCSSLFVYCTQVLRLSEGAAYHRIEAARVIRSFPLIADWLRDGSITLTTVSLLRPHLTFKNHGRLLEEARHKSKREVEQQIARLAPKPEVPALVRRLPDIPPSARIEPIKASPPAEVEAESAGRETTTLAAGLVTNRGPEPRLEPLSPNRFLLRLSLTAAGYENLRRARGLMRHSLPSGDLGAVVERALELLVEQLERRKFARTTQPKSERGSCIRARRVRDRRQHRAAVSRSQRIRRRAVFRPQRVGGSGPRHERRGPYNRRCVSSSRSLEPAAASPSQSRVAALEAQLAERIRELTTLQTELLELQNRYLAEIGPLYAELAELEASVADVEIRLGFRPAESAEPVDTDEDAEPPAGCGQRSSPSVDLKRIFRDVAKAVHPDRAMDDAARFRRHSLMAEANRAYAEQDEDRLRLILRAWEQSPEAVVGDTPEAAEARLARRAVELEMRLADLERECAAVRGSAIARLQRRIAETRAQGWDLFAEMLLHVKREIARARARLASIRPA